MYIHTLTVYMHYAVSLSLWLVNMYVFFSLFFVKMEYIRVTYGTHSKTSTTKHIATNWKLIRDEKKEKEKEAQTTEPVEI